MKTRHTWVLLPSTKAPDMPTFHHWQCTLCGCTKTLGSYEGATPSYQRSKINYIEQAPACVDMGQQSIEPLD